jgi:molybdate transport system substrate-binding protein
MTRHGGQRPSPQADRAKEAGLSRRALLGGGALAVATAWPGSAAMAQPAGRPVSVFAAASLQTALSAIAAAWRTETGRAVTLTFGASSALARQIDQGAPADLFVSADLEWMDWAQGRNLIRPETRRSLLGNRLVLITARDAALTLRIEPGFGLVAALGDSRLATGAPQSTPIGRYAQQALTTLGVWRDVAPRIAGAENVRVALALVARGEAKLGVVYETDARSEPRVAIVDRFPADSHSPIVYPAALTAASTSADAGAFLEHLRSPAAARIFEAEGFAVLP